MALIECPECSKSVSSTIDSCIHCGYRLKTPANKNSKAQVSLDSSPASNSREMKQPNIRSIEALDSAAYPFVRFVLFRPIFLASVLGLFVLAIWFMVWTSILLQPECSALYDFGGEAAAASQYGHLLGYVCVPDYSGTILGSLQTLTDKGIGYLKIPVPPLVLGILCELIGLLGIGISALAFRKLLTQFRNSSKPDTIGSLRKLFSSRPVLASSLLAVSAAALAILVWTFPLLGPRCAVFLPLNGPEGKLLGGSGLTHYFNYVCMPFDPSLFDPSKTGPSAFLIGALIQIICIASLIAAGIVFCKLYKNNDLNFSSSQDTTGTKTKNEADSTANPLLNFVRSKKGILSAALGVLALIAIVVSVSLITSNSESRPLIIEAGGQNTCFADHKGKVVCWGDDTFGVNDVPSDLPKVKQISIGSGTFACAVLDDDSVNCWGGTYDGSVSRPPSDYFGKVKKLTSGPGEACAIKQDESVKCWGFDNLIDPIDPKQLGKVSQIDIGNGNICAITATQSLFCLGGGNYYGQDAVPSDLGKVSAMSVEANNVCALGESKLRCWGNNSSRQTDVPSDLGPVTQFGVGISNGCALTVAKKVVCWGSSYPGHKISDVPKDLEPVSQLSVGFEHSCAITTSEQVRCWGENYGGQVDVPSHLSQKN